MSKTTNGIEKIDFKQVLEKANEYKADMAKFLRDMIAIPSESCDEEKVIQRIKTEMEKVGFDEITIDPMGNIIPCSSWRMPVGSLLKNNFKAIWQSSMLSYFKNIEYAPDKCHECLHFDICKGACPLYWKACGLKELDGEP